MSYVKIQIVLFILLLFSVRILTENIKRSTKNSRFLSFDTSLDGDIDVSGGIIKIMNKLKPNIISLLRNYCIVLIESNDHYENLKFVHL